MSIQKPYFAEHNNKQAYKGVSVVGEMLVECSRRCGGVYGGRQLEDFSHTVLQIECGAYPGHVSGISSICLLPLPTVQPIGLVLTTVNEQGKPNMPSPDIISAPSWKGYQSPEGLSLIKTV